MTSKERARLRGLANGIETVLQIGKDGIGENLIHQADITLEARELIKGRVLDGCTDYTPRTAAEALAKATDSEVIQVIGSKFVLYRKKKAVETERKASKPRKVRHQRTNKRESVNRSASRPGERKPFRTERFEQRDGERKPSFRQRDGERKPSQASRDGQRKKPPLSLRDISPGGRDADGKAGKRFRVHSGTDAGRRDKKRSSAPLGRGTGREVRKSGVAQRKAVRPGQARDALRGARNRRK